MHELPYKPPDYGSSEGTSFFPCRPTVKHRSHSLQRKAWLGRVGFVSLRRTVRAIVAVAPFARLSLFPRSSSLACAHKPDRKKLPFETTA